MSLEPGARTLSHRARCWQTHLREEIERIAARVMRATFLGDALSREELRELYHLVKHIYHEAKKFGEEMMENPDEHKRRE
jgi:hypothetical protein